MQSDLVSINRTPTVQQPALVGISSSAIAWLIRDGEWHRFEEIVKLNGSRSGGVFNVIIPLNSQDEVAAEYQSFLIDFDPDFVILAPNMAELKPSSVASRLNPFAVLSWDVNSRNHASFSGVDFLQDPVLLNPMKWINRSGVQMSSYYTGRPRVAVEDPERPDASRLAFVACGDVEPAHGQLKESLSPTQLGYRERFLARLLKPNYNWLNVVSYFEPSGNEVPAPDRQQLKSLIQEQYQFPLQNTYEIFWASIGLQGTLNEQQYSFLSFTGTYSRNLSDSRSKLWPQYRTLDRAELVVLVSEGFELREAIFYWNMRARDIHVAWIAAADLDAEKSNIADWLGKSNFGNYRQVVFAAFDNGSLNLTTAVEELQVICGNANKMWFAKSASELLVYDYPRPFVEGVYAPVLQTGSKCVISASFGQEIDKANYLGTIELPNIRLPQNRSVSSKLVSRWTVSGPAGGEPYPLYRITASGHFRSRIIGSYHPIEFNVPTALQTVEVLFADAGLHGVFLTADAQYQQSFITRAGGIEQSSQLLVRAPMRQLFESLTNHREGNPHDKPAGILLSFSDKKRRLLSHQDIWKIVESAPGRVAGAGDPTNLPQVIVSLLENKLLERGFALKCRYCYSLAWYPAQQVGQEFQCSLCYQQQPCTSNPLWLYKLPEVVARGFERNMEVPLLVLRYLKRKKSIFHFEYILDADIQETTSPQSRRNIDLCCLCDGHLYIGEAKSEDNIKPDQFSLYERLCNQLSPQGVVFATTKHQWSSGTQARIAMLRRNFSGEVIELTDTDLYLDDSLYSRPTGGLRPTTPLP